MQTACSVVLFNKFEFSVRISLHTLNKDTTIVRKGWCMGYNYYFMWSKKMALN